MSLVKKITQLALTGEADHPPIQLTLQAPTSYRSVEVALNQQIDRMKATGEIFQEAMQEMSEIERRASYLASITAAVRDHHTKLAEARNISQAEQEAQQERFENYLRRLGQLAELGNRVLIVEAGKATEAVSRRTVGDTLGDAGIQIRDVFLTPLPPAKR